MIQALWSLDQQFQNKNGSILTHGKIYVYYSGRTALATTYSDEDGTVVNPNPIILDNNGRAVCFASSMYSYTVVVCDAYGKELFSYNITLHDAVGTAEKVFVIGSDGSVQVETTTLPNGVQYDLSVNTDIIATKELVENVSSTIQSKLDKKKDLQEEKSYSGSQTKTITNISQDANGVITVNYEDIDLPTEVPNVEITSPNGTIDVQSTTDVQTNTKTFTIDVKNDQMQSFIGYYGKSQYEYRPSNTQAAYTIPIGKWDSYTYNGDFITNDWDSSENNASFLLKPGLYLVHAVVQYQMNENQSKKNDAGYIRVATGTHNGWEDGTRYKDWSSEYLDEHECSITVSFIRRITAEEGNNTLYIAPYFPYGVNFACIHELQIVKLDTVVGQGGGGSGTTYSAGDAIDLTNDTISVKYAKGLEITTDNKLQLKVGKGLTLDNDTLEVTIDNSVGEVVATVEKLQNDLDKKITTTYPFAQITTMSDFAVYGVTNTSRMIGQLFAVPIASEIRKDETLLCVNALQNFSGNVSFGIFEYDFAANNGTGSTYWIADTGTVSIQSGENRFKLKNVLNNNYEIKSSMLYYAVVAIAGNAPINGLMLGSSPAYSQNVNANPKYTLIVSNMDKAIDWTTGTLQGAYFQGYNEQYDIPRLFMMLRNGEGSTPIPVTEPFIDIGPFTLEHQYKVSNLFSMIPNAEGAVYRKVIPTQDVDIASFRYVDYHGSVGQQSSYPVLIDDTYTPMKTIGDGTWTLGNSDHTKIDGTHYVHEFTFSTPVHLTANTAYWFMVGGNMNKLGDEWIITYKTPTVTNDLLLVKNMNNVDQWIIPDSGEYQSSKPGMYLRLSDGTKNWVI